MQLNESEDINISNCADIDITELDALYVQLVLSEASRSAYRSLNELLNFVESRPIHYCAWLNDRILNNCTGYENGITSSVRDTLNDDVCGNNHRSCSPLDLCSIDEK